MNGSLLEKNSSVMSIGDCGSQRNRVRWCCYLVLLLHGHFNYNLFGFCYAVYSKTIHIIFRLSRSIFVLIISYSVFHTNRRPTMGCSSECNSHRKQSAAFLQFTWSLRWCLHLSFILMTPFALKFEALFEIKRDALYLHILRQTLTYYG